MRCSKSDVDCIGGLLVRKCRDSEIVVGRIPHRYSLESKQELLPYQGLGWQQTGHEVCNCFENSLIDMFLRLTRCLELALRHAQGMIAAFDNAQKVWGFHLGSNLLKEIQRTQRVARALHKQDGRSKRAQNLVSKFCAVAHSAERIAKANQAVYFLLERQMTSDPAAHALADQDCPVWLMFLARSL